jgi:hypothetical protein
MPYILAGDIPAVLSYGTSVSLGVDYFYRPEKHLLYIKTKNNFN